MNIWHYSDNSAQVLFYVRSLRSVLCAAQKSRISKKQTKKPSYLIPFLLLRSFCPEQNQTAVTGLGLSINFSLACGSRWFKSSSDRQRSLVCCWLSPALSFTFVYRGSGQQTDSHTHTQRHTRKVIVSVLKVEVDLFTSSAPLSSWTISNTRILLTEALVYFSIKTVNRRRRFSHSLVW